MENNLASPSSYGRRWYRQLDGPGSLASFTVAMGETDLLVRAADAGLQRLVSERVIVYRRQIEAFLADYPEVRMQLHPFVPSTELLLPPVVKEMLAAGHQAGVGPMAAVAGAIAERVGRDLLPYSPTVMVENGGDIFLAGKSSYTLGIFAGASPFAGKLAIRLSRPLPFAAGVCSSSATIGHSLSFGSADLVTIYADSTAAADALATAMGNRVHHKDDLQPVVNEALRHAGVHGVVIIKGEDLAAGGALELIPVAGSRR
ncbi:MAG: UPF0280 family protein [Deltaproteobacteria bacterium]|nr:UPF0280 family protein [Candidatus Anaeroferrophillus wilburensis]MBN2889897.1 UPF0280 family protein [Deltaproteobacteria bacterium]